MSHPYQSAPTPPSAGPYPSAGYGAVQGFRSVPANWGWAVAACVFFWPLGFSAVSAAGRVLPALLDGDVNAAMTDSAKARRLGGIALGIVLVLAALYFVAVVLALSVAVHSCGSAGC